MPAPKSYRAIDVGYPVVDGSGPYEFTPSFHVRSELALSWTIDLLIAINSFLKI